MIENNKINIWSEITDYKIIIYDNLLGNITQSIIDTKNKITIDSLISLGWTPPNKDKKNEKANN